MRLAVVALALVACRTQAPASNDAAQFGSASSSSSAPIVESPPPPPSASTVAAAPSASAGSFARPTRADEIPAAWLACSGDADCAAIKSACCGAWPTNIASRDRVRDAVTAADAARGFCRNRMCVMKVDTPACDHGKCVIH